MATILLVEDDPVIRHAFAALLMSEGHEAVAAASSQAAQEAAARRPPQLLLMDVGLPGEDGIDCALRLRAHQVGCPLVFLTAHGGPAFVARAIAADPYAYLVKPITGEQLLPVVQTALLAAERGRQKEERLLAALADSREISAAVGMLAERHQWTVAEAFSALRLMARSEGRRVLDLAADITNRRR